jgi:hypothetical protein
MPENIHPKAAGALVARAHHHVADALAAAGSEVRLASPFMGPGVLHRFTVVARTSPATWRVLTKLDAAAVAHGSLSTQGLRQLLDAGVEVRSLANLHAKVFLSDPDFGLIGSANATDAGLGGPEGRVNIELGVRLDASQRLEAIRYFDGWWDSASPVNEARIKEVEEAARTLPVSVSVMVGEPGPADDVVDQARTANQLLAEAAGVRLWLKAVYQDEAAADLPSGNHMGSSRQGRPSFEVGDLVLIYANGPRRCNAVVEVTSLARLHPEFSIEQGRPQEHANRWPWVNDVQPRLHVPSSAGVPLSHLGITGQALQRGHKRLGLGEFAAAVRYLAAGAAEATP